LAPDILRDQKDVWTFPAHLVRGKDWKPTLAVVAATGALMALDPHDAPYFRRTSSFTDFNKAFSGRNTMLGMAILPASVYVAGLEKRDTYAQHTALLAGEAAADVEIVALVMKDAVRRVRPSDIAPQGNFSDTWFEARGSILGKNASFPSGHAIEAFSIATVFAERYRKHRWVPWVAYGLATTVGISRISLQAHFPSDVFAGAALGYFITHNVVLPGR
jgi:membrane-associated phospholipid phosphatase